MEKKLNIQKVEAALKRAAKEGVSGSREARSGRFLHPTTSLADSKKPAGQNKRSAKKY
jgi:hypothetical protein